MSGSFVGVTLPSERIIDVLQHNVQGIIRIGDLLFRNDCPTPTVADDERSADAIAGSAFVSDLHG